MSWLRPLLPPLILGTVGCVVLVQLCIWQLDRLVWKEGLIASIEERLAAAPVDLPLKPDPARDHLLRVRLTGKIGLEEIDVLTAMREFGPGFRIIAPMNLDDGDRVLVDLGYVPERLKDLSARTSSFRLQDRDTDEVVGLLFWPNEKDEYIEDPDLGRGIWFARELDPMAEALGTRPLLVVAESHPGGDLPLPRPPGADLPNNHLQYVFTWGTLAVVWAIMSVLWGRQRLREAKDGD